jgi:DnaK suppressor protein
MTSPTSQPPAVPPEWAWHQRALTRLRDRLIREQEARHSALRVPRADSNEDFGDAAEKQTERDELVAELAQEEVELAEVDAALARIRLGTYGVCEETGVPIAPERLRAIPWTRYTQEAAGKREMRAKRLA